MKAQRRRDCSLDGHGSLAHEDEPVLVTERSLSPEDMFIDTDRYSSPEFLQRELSTLWMRCWHTVCREDEIDQVGSWREHRLGSRSFVIVRGADRRLRCFSNVCLHRGNLLCPGEGRSGTLRCPYHGWTWHLDGTLARVPDRTLFGTIVDDDYRLREVGCDTWGGFVMVNPHEGHRPSLVEHMEPLMGRLARYDLEAHVPMVLNAQLSLACNWKTFQDAFLEVYHLPFLHFHMLHFANELGARLALLGRHSLMGTPFGEASDRARQVTQRDVLTAYVDQMPVAARSLISSGRSPLSASALWKADADLSGPSGDGSLDRAVSAKALVAGVLREVTESTGFDTSDFAEEEFVDVWQYLVFPNLLLSFHPGHVFATWVLPDPVDPNRCTARVANLRWARPDERALSRAPIEVFDGDRMTTTDLARFGRAVEQDLVNLPRQQRGLRMGGLSRQTLSRHEARLAHFHHVVDEFLV